MDEMEKIFECQRCGRCCLGKTTVSLDENDRRRMAAALGMSEDEAREKYWRVTGNVTQMKVVDGHCIFYSNGCTVHAGRPWRCAQWPLHPSLLTDPSNFSAIKASCPGMNQKMPYEEFCRILQTIMDAEGEILQC